MKHFLLLTLGFLFFNAANAQFTSDKYLIVDDMGERIRGDQSKLNKKAKTSNKTCGNDTITYPYFKASGLVTINVSNGYSLGQFYEAPAELTISGFEFYAWQTGRNKDTVTLYCDLYKAGADSLPTGSPLRSDTLLIDSTFGGGALSVLRQSAEFKPLTYDSAYILVLSSRDTSNGVAVVTNDYAANDGDLENLACGSISNLWYHFLDLNISGRTLNCDVLMHPYVSYKYYNDFSFTDCYNQFDTAKFTNTSSPFYSSRMYNRYTFFNLEYFCHQYRYENRYYIREVDGVHKYPRLMNDSVRLISTIYTFTGGRTCLDTVQKDLSYMPMDINFSGEKNLCSGDFSIIKTNTNAQVEWFHNLNDTAPFLKNERYSTPDLFKNDTFYAQAVNNNCRTPLKTFAINVTDRPSIPAVTHDSVCLNSKANLSAKSDVGDMTWYADSSTNNPVYTGAVLQTNELSDDTFFYVRAQNKQCFSEGLVRVNALVSKDFAPQAPKVVGDTSICLLAGEIQISATADEPIRWYDVPSGGTPFQNGGKYKYTPSKRGSDVVYVDAFDNRCASTRVPVRINTLHFPSIQKSFDEHVCEKDSLEINLNGIHGNIDWYTQSTGGTSEFTGLRRWFKGNIADQKRWLLPREQFCYDTIRHPFILRTTQEIHPSFGLSPSTCSGDSINLKSEHTGGKTIWLTENNTFFKQGNPINTGPLSRHSTFKVYVEENGCIGDTLSIPIEVFPLPNSNYDFQINKFRTVLFQAKVTNQGTYLWDFGDLGQTKSGRLVTHDFSDDGDFNVQLKVTTPDGCVDSTSKTIRLENTGSIIDIKDIYSDVYPNPFQDQLNIKLNNGHPYNSVQISDAVGQVLYRSDINKGSSKNLWINTSSLPSGTYFVNFIGEQHKSSYTLVK